MHRRIVTLLLAALVAMAGCTGTGAEPSTSPTVSMSPPPAPLVVFTREVDGCPPNAPVQQQPIQAKFTIPDGYDEAVVSFHTSGEGRITVSVRDGENRQVWGENDKTINSAPTACGGHGTHSGDGVDVPVEAGEFSVSISYAGAVALHLDITARSSRANDTMHEH